jgi:hypothetical protein
MRVVSVVAIASCGVSFGVVGVAFAIKRITFRLWPARHLALPRVFY